MSAARVELRRGTTTIFATMSAASHRTYRIEHGGYKSGHNVRGIGDLLQPGTGSGDVNASGWACL